MVSIEDDSSGDSDADDDDFKPGEESDVADEFDSNVGTTDSEASAKGSGSGSGSDDESDAKSKKKKEKKVKKEKKEKKSKSVIYIFTFNYITLSYIPSGILESSLWVSLGKPSANSIDVE